MNDIKMFAVGDKVRIKAPEDWAESTPSFDKDFVLKHVHYRRYNTVAEVMGYINGWVSTRSPQGEGFGIYVGLFHPNMLEALGE